MYGYIVYPPIRVVLSRVDCDIAAKKLAYQDRLLGHLVAYGADNAQPESVVACRVEHIFLHQRLDGIDRLGQVPADKNRQVSRDDRAHEEHASDPKDRPVMRPAKH